MRFPPQSIASSCWWRSEIYETAPIFLLELGDDFAFLGRQRRLRIDNTWFRTDLVFFRRRLRGGLIVDLKIGKISYADAGHMHLYLNNAREHSMNAHKLAEELGTKTPSSSKTKGGMPEPRDDLNPSHK